MKELDRVLTNSSESQEEVRIKVLQILKKNPRVLTTLAKEIGIGSIVLISFLKGKDIDHKWFSKIKKWAKKT